MKYSIYEMINGKVKTRCYFKAGNDEELFKDGFVKVSQSKTKKEAEKIIKNLGGEFELV